MPDTNSLKYLEIKKRVSLLERNLLTALQNVNILTLEVERMRNLLAAKDGFEGLTEPVTTADATQAQAQAHAQSQASSSAEGGRRGPMTGAQGRTLKVINN